MMRKKDEMITAAEYVGNIAKEVVKEGIGVKLGSYSTGVEVRKDECLEEKLKKKEERIIYLERKLEEKNAKKDKEIERLEKELAKKREKIDSLLQQHAKQQTKVLEAAVEVAVKSSKPISPIPPPYNNQ